jgi:glycosyltransferase involved in cell wall biosynthesis
LRVLHIINGLELGGAETLLFRLVTTASEGFEHEVICLGHPAWYSVLLAERGIPVRHLGMTSGLSVVRGLPGLRRLVRESGADVIQSWMYFANVLSGIAAARSGLPVIWSIHGSTFRHLGGPSRLCAYAGMAGAGHLSSFIIHCSERAARWHAARGYAASPNVVIHNGYDASAFAPDDAKRAATRAELGFRPDEFVVGTVGRWHVEKDVPSLLSAVAAVRTSHPSLRCMLIGPGLDASNAQLMDAVRSHGFGQDVLALGRRADVADLYRALDLHVLSSRSEAFPNVVAESMLSGTPNIVTDVGDAALMVGETGWAVPPGSPQALADAIADAWVEWSSDQQRWQERRAAARRRIAGNFTLERMITGYENIWNKVSRRAGATR